MVPASDEDWTLTPGLERMRAYLEAKTVWRRAAIKPHVQDPGGRMPVTVQPVIVTPSMPLCWLSIRRSSGPSRSPRPAGWPGVLVGLQIGNAELGVVADGDAQIDAPQRICST